MNRTMRRMISGVAVGGFCCIAYTALAEESKPNAAAPAVAAPTATAPATQPATQPIDPNIRALVDQLGNPDAAVRDDAAKRIKDMGRAALPALNEQADSGNPEIQTRVAGLIRHAERHLPPAAPARDGFASSSSVSTSISNGKRTVDVDDNGYKIKIRQDAEGIVLNVTGVEEGKEVTETYKAKDAVELKRDNPEVFALYDKYNNDAGGGNGGAAIMRHQMQLQLGGNNAAGGPQIQLPDQAIAQIRDQMQKLAAEGKMTPEQIKQALDHLDHAVNALPPVEVNPPANPAGAPATKPTAETPANSDASKTIDGKK